MIYFTPFKRQAVILMGHGDVGSANDVCETAIGNVAVIELCNLTIPGAIGESTLNTKSLVKGRKRVKLAFANTEIIDLWINHLQELRALLIERNKTDE